MPTPNFLTAEWRKLILINYRVDEAVLLPYLPYGVELDPWQGDHLVSLVGFLFTDVRLRGLPIPFHRSFEEVNLRFYVRQKVEGSWRRGVVFVKEIVPRAAISIVANAIYGEHYCTRRMAHCIEKRGDQWHVGYEWWERGEQQLLSAVAATKAIPIATNSIEEFITEHYWGYTRRGVRRTGVYEVAHPVWEHYPLISHNVLLDVEKVYGRQWSPYLHEKAHSALLAEGSAVQVRVGSQLYS